MPDRPNYSGIPVALQQQITARQQTSPLFDSLLTTFFNLGGSNGGVISWTAFLRRS